MCTDALRECSNAYALDIFILIITSHTHYILFYKQFSLLSNFGLLVCYKRWKGEGCEGNMLSFEIHGI